MSTPINPRGATIFKPSRWLNRATRTLAVATVAALIATLAPADAAIGSAAAPAPADSETVESPSNSASDSWSEDDICFQDWGYCEDFMPLEVITEPAMPHTGSILAGTSIKPNLGTWKYAASIDAHWRLDDDWLAYTRWNSGQSFSDLPSVEIPNDAAGSNLYVEISISGKYSGEEYREYDLGNVGALAFINSPKPIIQGLPQVGQSLSVSQSAWNPQATYQYQWLRNGKNISGATKEALQDSECKRGLNPPVSSNDRAI